MEQFGTTDLKPARKETWRQPKTPFETIVKLLLTLATARQAEFGAKAQETYARGLDGFLEADIRMAVQTLALTEPGEGKSSMPKLGEMITACQKAAQKRFEAVQQENMRQEEAYRKAHPERFCTWKEVLEEMAMMQNYCRDVFGADWRQKHPGIDLTGVYALAVTAAESAGLE